MVAENQPLVSEGEVNLWPIASPFFILFSSHAEHTMPHNVPWCCWRHCCSPRGLGLTVAHLGTPCAGCSLPPAGTAGPVLPKACRDPFGPPTTQARGCGTRVHPVPTLNDKSSEGTHVVQCYLQPQIHCVVSLA